MEINIGFIEGKFYIHLLNTDGIKINERRNLDIHDLNKTLTEFRKLIQANQNQC